MQSPYGVSDDVRGNIEQHGQPRRRPVTARSSSSNASTGEIQQQNFGADLAGSFGCWQRRGCHVVSAELLAGPRGERRVHSFVDYRRVVPVPHTHFDSAV